jgi:PKD repeat protein
VRSNSRIEALRKRCSWPRASAVPALLLCCLTPASVATAGSSIPRRTRYARITHACPTAQPGEATCFALVRVPVSASAAAEPGVAQYTAGDGALESGPAGGLTPAELASAYGYSPTAGGSGQTLAIVDAYDDPSIESDLEAFDTEYGIAACTEANGCFTKVSQTGSTVSLPAADTTGWSVEMSLDVEVAHSTCPHCKILLVEADSASFANLAAAVNEAVTLGADVVSNSYGGSEEEPGSTERAAFNHPGVVIAAATGDEGYYDWTKLNRRTRPPGRPNMPASLPTVVAVGGTTLDLTEAGTRESETVWNGNGPFDEEEDQGVTGGGCSTLFPAEIWQKDAPGFGAAGCAGKRLDADVAAVANPRTGFDIYDSYECGTECEKFKGGRDWVTIGGTSLSTPLVASLYALAGGSNGVSYPALTLYGHLGDSSALYDVTEGGNGICDDEGSACEANRIFGFDVDCEGTTACNAAPGFDGPSGVGAPSSLGLFEPLLPAAAITLPQSAKAGLPASFSGSTSSDPYPGGAIASYSWSWGDGTPESSGVTASHTYAVPGEYTLTLTVRDSYGLTSHPATVSAKVIARTEKELEEERHSDQETEAHEAEVKRKKEAEAAAKTEEEAATKKGAEAARSGEAEAANKRAEEAAALKRHEEETAAKANSDAPAQGVNSFLSSAVPLVPDAELASTSLRVSAAGVVKLEIGCPAGESSCSGTVTLRTLGAITSASARKRALLTLVVGSFEVAGGKLRTVTLRLSPKARALLATAHALRARATLLAHDPHGAIHTTSAIVTLRLAGASHGTG